MALSDDERLLLHEIEQSLYKDDPQLTRVFTEAAPPSLLRARRFIAGVVLILLGVGVVLMGVATSIAAVGVGGFVVMLGGGIIIHRSVRPWLLQRESLEFADRVKSRPPRDWWADRDK